MSEEQKSVGPIRVTREELYIQVWETPMSRLAARYGISWNGLAKICDRLKIPYPPRGYWAKKAAGKKVIQYRLSEPDAGTPRDVTISPTPPPAAPPDLPSEVQEKVEAVRSSGSIHVAQRLAQPHPIIGGWLLEHEREKERARRERDPWRRKLYDPGEFTQMDRRGHRILDALFKAIERHGGKIEEGERKELIAVLDGEPIQFQLREKLKQVRRPLTKEEEKWRLPGDKDWKQELQPTGKFVFAIKTYLRSGLRTEWLETDAKPLEQLLPDILETFIAAGPLLAEERRQREEAAHQRHIAEQKRYEEERRRKKDDNRWRCFMDIADGWRKAELARRFLEVMKKSNMDLDQEIDGRSLRDWINWAESRAHLADPFSHGVNAIFETVASIDEWNYRS
jgi:hypothetical protein